ncbi:MAG: MFS transporter, partial [Alphaproteobacteria bacterium]|nr:MFS transporter [Alphaproteobacteria bacterium]
VIRRRYSLYYALVFMSGARRQIFMVFAGFMMVEKFGFSPFQIATLFFLNHLISAIIAPGVGRIVKRYGERASLVFEYLGLIGIFIGYAFVTSGTVAAGLYVLDHIFFAFAIAIKSYLHKIAQREDIPSTAAVSFTINHIAAVVIPVLFGILWLTSPMWVFLLGAAMAFVSLILASRIPRHPSNPFEHSSSAVPSTNPASPSPTS